MTTPRERSHDDESGFVLIGVVVFVLALTILGLSLFSLSGYEAQFLGRSLNDEQAFYFAMGGIERAKFALGKSPYRLDNVSQNLPLEGVTTAEAAQNQNGVLKTAGLVDWKGSNIRIRVTAQSNGVTRSLEGWYDPTLGENYYKRLITTPGPITIAPLGGASATPRIPALLSGDVWEHLPNDSTNWYPQLAAPLPNPIRADAVPIPDAVAFCGGHLPARPAPWDPATNTFDLRGPSNAPRYYQAPAGLTTADLSLYDTGNAPAPTILVNGRAILLVPNGVRFEGAVRVMPNAGHQDCLVIVAGAGTDPYHNVANPGIWFFGGIESLTVPVILVSSGKVLIEHFNNASGHSEVAGLSIFAPSVYLLPPDSHVPPDPTRYMRLTHTPDSPIDQQIDWLAPFGALPNILQSSDYKLALVPDTWKDLTP
jgi:hypothetical protein